MKTYLNTSDGMHEYAKRHGAVFDEERQQWCVVGDVPAELENLIPREANKRAPHIVAPACPLCGFHTILRSTKKKDLFWGCSQFPRCRGSIDYEKYLDIVGVETTKHAIDALGSSTSGKSSAQQPKFIKKESLPPELQTAISEIAFLAEAAFGSLERAHNWLRTPKVGLSGRTPLGAMQKLEGCQQVKQLILSCR